MNKKDFINELRRGLHGYRGEKLKSILSFYSEMIDDRIEEGMSEEDAVAAVGGVDEVIGRILSDHPLLCEGNGERRKLRAYEIVLLVLGAPLWIPLLLAAAGVMAAIYIVLWSLILSLWALELPFFIMYLISKALLPGCIGATKGAAFLSKKGFRSALGIFKRDNI